MSNTGNENDFSPKESLPTTSGMTDKTRDEQLWKIAKKRASFKMVFIGYIGVNLMLVAIWYFTSGPGSYFWPVWPMIGWGLGIIFQFADAYFGNTVFSQEKEFEKLKRKK
jgi:hypothetical protein